MQLASGPFSLREALERGPVVVRERANIERVRIDVTADPAADVVEGDARRIQQVLLNLLSNAVKFTPPGGAVDATIARVDGEVWVSVSDTGPGIAPRRSGSSCSSSRLTDAVGICEYLLTYG